MTRRATTSTNIFVIAAVLAAVLVAAMLFEVHRATGVVCYGAPSTASGLSTTSPTLVPSGPDGVSVPVTTLPPSHDNDAGIARSPDLTPDADRDTFQKPRYCLKDGRRVVGIAN
jgi:hypothetical protein